MVNNLEKLSSFIDLLLEYKLDDLEFDVYTKRKTLKYSISIDTKVPHIIPNLFGLNFGQTKHINLYLCPKNGDIIFSKDGYDEFVENDMVFVIKYSKIIEDNYNRIQKYKLDSIIDTSLEELKLLRESNLNKLI